MFEQRLDLWFRTFQGSVDLARDLASRRANYFDVITLVCARLDGLSLVHAGEGAANRASFVKFVTDFGGHRKLMNSVSVSRLWNVLKHYRRTASDIIPKAGRVRRWEEDQPFISLIDAIDLPLTANCTRQFLKVIMDALSQAYTVSPVRSPSKPFTAPVDEVVQTVSTALIGGGYAENIPSFEPVFKDWVKSFRMAEQLYSEYRNESIHGWGVAVNPEKFYTEAMPYWHPRYGLIRHYNLEFPAPFLCELLQNCITTYKKQLLSSKQLPFPVWAMLKHNSAPEEQVPPLAPGAIPDRERVRLRIKSR